MPTESPISTIVTSTTKMYSRSSNTSAYEIHSSTGRPASTDSSTEKASTTFAISSGSPNSYSTGETSSELSDSSDSGTSPSTTTLTSTTKMTRVEDILVGSLVGFMVVALLILSIIIIICCAKCYSKKIRPTVYNISKSCTVIARSLI